MNKQDDKYNYFIPIEIDLEKSGEKVGDAKYDSMYIKGMASDMTMDTDDELLDPNGYDLNRFVNYGFLNYEHQVKNSPKAVIGEPTKAFVRNGEMFLEGKLYKESELARDLYDTAIMLKKSGSKRRVGFSIEGKALERDAINPKRITKALITNCAITFTPKNKNTFMDIVKGTYDELFKEVEPEIEKSESPNGGEQYLIDITNPETGMRYMVKKDFSIKIEKAMTTDSGRATIKEDVEKKPKNQIDYSDNEIRKSIVILSAAKKIGLISENISLKIKECF